MAFYKLYKQRTNYESMIHEIDCNYFRKEMWDEIEKRINAKLKKTTAHLAFMGALVQSLQERNNYHIW